MSDDVKHPEDDLGLGTQGTEGDDVSTDGTESTANQEADDSSTDQEDSDKERKRQEAVQKQVTAWAADIVAGKRKLEDLPEDKRWLKPLIESEVGSAKNDKPVIEDEPKDDIASLVRFENLKEKLQNADLSNDEAAKVQSKYSAYVKKGFTKEEALNEAIDFTGVREKLNGSRKADIPSIKTGAGVKAEEKFEGRDPNSLSPKELAKALKSK